MNTYIRTKFLEEIQRKKESYVESVLSGRMLEKEYTNTCGFLQGLDYASSVLQELFEKMYKNTEE